MLLKNTEQADQAAQDPESPPPIMVSREDRMNR